MNEVVFYPEDERSITRALQSLHADQATLERHRAHSTELQIAIDDLEGLRDRMRSVEKERRDQLAVRLAYPVAS